MSECLRRQGVHRQDGEGPAPSTYLEKDLQAMLHRVQDIMKNADDSSAATALRGLAGLTTSIPAEETRQSYPQSGNPSPPGRRHPHFRTVALVMSAVAALTFGCTTEPEATRDDAVGVWKSQSGGRMEFRDDGRFTATDIALNTSCSKEDDAFQHERTSGTGTWKPADVPDEGPGTRIDFDAKNGSLRNCLMWSVFTGEDPLSEMQLRHQYGEPERYRRTTPTPSG